MTCVLFNGSPRGKGSNTRIILDAFIEGAGTEELEQLYIYRDEDESLIKAFNAGDTIIFAFPLYTDSVPGRVKLFLELIKDSDWKGKRIGVIVQSGFPEAVQSSFIAGYFEQLAKKQGAGFIGAVLKGGVEGIQVRPQKWTAGLLNQFRRLGKTFRETGTFDEATLAEFRKPWKLNPARRCIYKVMSWSGLANFYWNYKLKQNNAFKDRFARPYAE